ncbi:MAG: adenylate/guanylate cyclase domain-containing protein, partial [Rhodospirillaceae bacterium]
QREQLKDFAATALAGVTESKSELQAMERFGVNLYVAGGAGTLAEFCSLDEPAKLALLQDAIEHIGTNSAAAKSFCERLDASAMRPRFRKLMDAGAIAMNATLTETTSRQPPLSELIQEWAQRTGPAAESKNVTFLLTDIVGSTALTSKLGNSGAQRIVRAHNAIAREAAKDYKGQEIKHTGDGMLLTFPDAAAAARAAMDIQQEADAYSKDNPNAPLELRVGLHAGSAGFEDGEYFGEPLLLLNGICDAADTGQIAVSQAIQSKCVGSVFRFADLGSVPVKNAPDPLQLFQLEWTPKSRAPKRELEYRQIGTNN